MYPVVFLDAPVLKIRNGGSVQRHACCAALAIGMDGEREVLGMWFGANEGAKFWMQVPTDLKQRGVVDGLKGFPEAIEAIFPATTVQTSIVHLIRHSLKYVPRRQYDAVVKERYWRSRSTSETDCPTYHQTGPTQLDGHPRSCRFAHRSARKRSSPSEAARCATRTSVRREFGCLTMAADGRTQTCRAGR